LSHKLKLCCVIKCEAASVATVERVEKAEKLKTMQISQKNYARLTKLASKIHSLARSNYDALTIFYKARKGKGMPLNSKNNLITITKTNGSTNILLSFNQRGLTS
jgi:hypothetical protein